MDTGTDETIQYYSSSPNRGIKYDAKGNSGGWYGTHLFFTGYNGSASAERLRITNSGIKIGGTGATVDSILDEDDMSSNDSAALATQQSIKAYVDANAGGASAINDLSDVSLGGSVSAGDLLVYSGSAWVNTTTLSGAYTFSADTTFTGGNYGIYMNDTGDNNSIRH